MRKDEIYAQMNIETRDNSPGPGDAHYVRPSIVRIEERTCSRFHGFEIKIFRKNYQIFLCQNFDRVTSSVPTSPKPQSRISCIYSGVNTFDFSQTTKILPSKEVSQVRIQIRINNLPLFSLKLTITLENNFHAIRLNTIVLNSTKHKSKKIFDSKELSTIFNE
jgi:hypothetical protein